MVKAIIFDMDDTLYPEYEYVQSGFKAVDEEIKKRGVSGFYNYSMKLFNNGDRGKIFNKTLDFLGVQYSDEDIRNLIRIYRNHTPSIELYKDAIEVLTLLKNQYVMGLITDGYSNAQHKKVEALSLEQYFEKIIITDDLGRENWKPSMVPFELIREYFNCQHEDLVYIGDNVSKDFISPNKLGWTTIRVERESGEYKNQPIQQGYEAMYKVKSLLQIFDIINFK